ncbi:MAG: SPOR domain-containing protein [Acidobacteriaceae bacterium]|nr:SPOR domain-containing protein [Acidobacteriaceae bacterium]
MPGEPITATPNWAELQGTLLEGGYELAECVASDESSASFRVRILGDRFTKAVANLFAPDAISGAQIALWAEARQFRNQNLGTPLASGQVSAGTASLPYVIFAEGEETLDAVLKQRPLTQQEAIELARSLVNALGFLHSRGFVGACVAPEYVLAIGDSIQFSLRGMRRINTPIPETAAAAKYKAPESGVENVTAAADIWCLGATLFEAVTQRVWSEERREEIGSLPAPVNTIVERCVDAQPQARCSLADIRAMLRGEQLPQVLTAGAAAAPSASAPIEWNAAQSLQQELRSPPTAATPDGAPRGFGPLSTETATARERAISDERDSPRLKNWLYAAAVLALVLIVIWLARPGRRPAQASRNAGRTGSAPQMTAGERKIAPSGIGPAREAWPSRVVGPGETTQPPAQISADGTRTRGALPHENREVWRVVAFTFNREADAQRQVQAIKEKQPRFSPEVFSPSGNGPPYLVVLGGRLNHNQAEQLRDKARANGFPRDTYSQNFNR